LLCLGAPAGLPAEVHTALDPGQVLDIRLEAGATRELELSLPAGAAADLILTQLSGLVDLDLRASDQETLNLRTEAGVQGLIDAPLVAVAAQRWSVVVRTRKQNEGARLSLALSTSHAATPADAARSAAFAHYAEAERLRRTNYRETVVIERAPDVDARTREAYRAAEAAYLLAGDACGLQRTRIGLARMQVAIGDYSGARDTASAALDAACEDGPAERAQALKTIGMAASYQADFAASAAASERALALYRQTGDLRYQGVVLGNLSGVYVELGATDRALASATGSLQAAESTADLQGVVFARKTIAEIHLARGELASALRDYRLTLENLAATPYPMIEGETWNDLGIVYHRLADFQESLQAYAAADAVWKKMNNRVGEADTGINKAETLLEIGDPRGASTAFAQALAIALDDGLKDKQVRAVRGLGSAQLVLGRVLLAERYFAASLAIARATGELAEQAYGLRALGGAELRRGNLHAAQRHAELALQLARKAADRNGEAATLEQLARTLAAEGALPAARRRIEAALAIIEIQRGQIDDPSLRTSYFASLRAYYDAEIEILMQLHLRHPGRGYDAAALGVAERARARTLQDVLRERSLDFSHQIPADLAAAERSAEEDLRTAAWQLGRVSIAASADGRRALLRSVDAANRRLDEIRGRIRAANPRYADLLQPASLDVDAVRRQRLAAHDAVLEYWLGGHASYVWVLRNDSFRVVKLPARARVVPLVHHLLGLLRTPADPGRAAGIEALVAAQRAERADRERAAAELAQMLIGKSVDRKLPQRIAIIADEELEELPFGVLSDPAGTPFGVTHDVTYLPSLSTLQWLARDSAPRRRAAAVAVIAAPILQAPSPSARQADFGLPALPKSRDEAQMIAAMLPKERVWLATGFAASRDRILATHWERYAVVHFATHAIVDRENPELSGIVLSQYDAQGHPEDGMLRMNDIYGLDMPADLVVLSGCETAAGRPVDAEGIYSLSRGFLYAGAHRVLASLWTVEDRATAEFMRRFYDGLLIQHMPAAAALRLAQQSLARDTRWSSPYYWGGFVLQGEW
jgi:CHAT domain-containing protein